MKRANYLRRAMIRARIKAGKMPPKPGEAKAALDFLATLKGPDDAKRKN
jgi:hypothetical protein